MASASRRMRPAEPPYWPELPSEPQYSRRPLRPPPAASKRPLPAMLVATRRIAPPEPPAPEPPTPVPALPPASPPRASVVPVICRVADDALQKAPPTPPPATAGIGPAPIAPPAARATEQGLQQGRAVGTREFCQRCGGAKVFGVGLIGGNGIRTTCAFSRVIAAGTTPVAAFFATQTASRPQARASADDFGSRCSVLAPAPTAVMAAWPADPGNTVVAEGTVAVGSGGSAMGALNADGPGNGHTARGQQIHRGIGHVLPERDGTPCRDVDAGVVQHAGRRQDDFGIHRDVERAIGAGAAAIECRIGRRDEQCRGHGGHQRPHLRDGRPTGCARLVTDCACLVHPLVH